MPSPTSIYDESEVGLDRECELLDSDGYRTILVHNQDGVAGDTGCALVPV